MRDILLLFVCLLVLSPAVLATNRYVNAGDPLQTVINEAARGDVITLQAGATFTGTFTLPMKSGTGSIVIESSMMTSLPGAGQRVNPSHAKLMARLISPNSGPALRALSGAHNYIIRGLEMASAPGIYSGGIVLLGFKETQISDVPYSITLDRVYIHGDPVIGGKRGIALNSRYTNIWNSYISDIKSTWQEAQAIGGWNGPGPFQIINNYVEASTENIMFGGAPSSMPNLVPTNILIRHNHVYKPLSWKSDDPTYAGTPWLVKNLLELKNASDVTVEGNVFENCWPMGQSGFAVVFTVRTQGDLMPWAVVQNVTFRNNIVRNANNGVNMLGADPIYGGVTRNITIRNNLFEKINKIFVQILHDCASTVIDHNTVLHGDGFLVDFDGPASTGFVYQNNIAARGYYGIVGGGTAEGLRTLLHYAPGGIVRRNVVAGASAGMYPPDNFFPASIDAVQFVDFFGGNYALAATSPYLTAGIYGKPLGVDFTALNAATANAAP